MALSVRQVVEVFHLVFTRALVAQGETKGLVALKGGCNLRFYFGSVRYSEDIDFDVTVIGKGTLKNKVERLFEAPTVVAPLKTHGILIDEHSAPKQTETTQRWKVGLRAPVVGAVRTKIEFSLRDAIANTTFAAVDAELLRAYNMPPFLLTRYDASRAVIQKVQALEGRSEPQARDVFDLNLLFARADTAGLRLDNDDRQRVEGAIDRAMSISYGEYMAQVVSYVDPTQASLYRARDAWNVMQDAVVARLEALR